MMTYICGSCSITRVESFEHIGRQLHYRPTRTISRLPRQTHNRPASTNCILKRPQRVDNVRRSAVVQLSLSTDDNDNKNSSSSSNNEQNQEEGSLVGAALLFAGTAIGAGMLALPAETAPAGFIPSATSLVFCWAFTYVTSLITLEATSSVLVLQNKNKSASVSSSSIGFLSVSRRALGPWGERVTALLFWSLLSAIIVAYTSEGGELLAQASRDLTGNGSGSVYLFSSAFMAFFGSLAIFGTERVDLVNRILVAGFLVAFLGLVGVGLPNIQGTTLLSGTAQNWRAVYPGATSVGILAFGAQNVVPTLLQYLGRDAERTRQAILVGSLLPLVMYLVWETIFFGLLPLDAVANASSGKIDIVTELGYAGGPLVQVLVKIFSACAVGSSMAGASVSLVDFFQDALSTSLSSTTTTTSETKNGLGQRLVAAIFALGPPLGLACIFPEAFLGALENAGLIFGVSLYGIIPAFAVLRLRQNADDNDDFSSTGSNLDTMSMPVSGGSLALYVIIALSAALVLPEFVRLGENLYFYGLSFV